MMIMKKLFAVAAFLLASTAAQAQYTFEYGGRTIRIDPDRGTISIPGVYDNTGRRSKRSRNDQDGERSRKPAPDQAKVDPQAPDPAPAEQAPAVAPAPATAKASPEPSTTTTTTTATDIITSTPPAASTPAPQVQQDAAPAVRPAPAPVVATAPAAQAPAAAPATVATASANSPLGTWLTEEKEGKVRIEACGVNLCGYSVDSKTNQNGEKVLINMKPAKESKWTGRIYDPNSGSTYDSTIALKGSDGLRVQGCAFGGMFCGGQTWTRLN
jgi:uncharacterized protein (DUF2147 family)